MKGHLESKHPMLNKKIIVFIAKSLDGYIADSNGGIDWLDSVPNPDGDHMGYNDLMAEIDAIIMGRNSFETVLGFGIDWPYTKPVFVLSNSLESIPQELADKVQLIKGTSAEILTQIHQQGFFSLYIDGGITIQNFLAEDLVDELRITTIPILLGGGIPLFGALEKAIRFDHVKTELYLGQLVQSHYKRKMD